MKLNPILDLPRPELLAMSWQDVANEYARRAGGAGDYGPDVIRQALSGTAPDVFGGFVGAEVVAGFQASPDNTTGWTTDVVLPNFRENIVGQLESVSPVKLHPRGSAANMAEFGYSAERWAMARFSSRAVIDEQDLADGQPIGMWSQALQAVGSTAAQLVPDLTFALLLANGDLGDGTPIFDATRGNVTDAPLSLEALDVAMGAIGNRTLTDDEGRPIHVGWRPRYLLVDPSILGEALRIVRQMQTGNEPPIVVRPESRLSSSGVVDPRTDLLIPGNAGSWLLAAEASSIPSVVVGSLDGQRRPVVTTRQLTQGQWGRDLMVSINAAVQVVQPGALYFSDSTGGTTTTTTTTE